MVHLSDFRYDSRIQRQARALAQRGDTVDLICLGEAHELRVGDGLIRVHAVGSSKPSGGATAYVRSYGRFMAAALRCLTALDLRHRFDLVEIHNMPDLLTLCAAVPRLRGAPVILNLHDTFPELFATKFNLRAEHRIVRLLELEERFSASLADRLVTVTDEARIRIQSRGVGVGRTVVVMNSPDERVFGPPRAPRLIPADGTVRVLYHGGTAPRFGVETLICAFDRLRSTTSRVTLRICGSGEERSNLAALASTIAPDRIDVAPDAVPFSAIPDELSAAHIGVVPTLLDRFTELLLPVKLLEYVHMGLPVISSRLPAITSYFSGEELRLVEPGDPALIAEAIEDACANPEAARALAVQATGRLAEIRWDRQRQRYLELVDELAQLRRRPLRPRLAASSPRQREHSASGLGR